MRARAAVIPSLGTTGILLAAALLMLALVSALVAFRAWPGGTGEAVPSIPVQQQAGSRVDLKQVRTASPPRTVKRIAAPARTPAITPRVTTAGLVKTTTTVDTSPTDIVKVPPGVRMSLPPAQTPTARPTTAPVTSPPAPVAGEDPSFVPEPALPPDAVNDTVTGVVEPLPGDGAEGAPQLTVAPDEATLIGITLGSTTISVGLG
jgi:hypothetical protein